MYVHTAMNKCCISLTLFHYFGVWTPKISNKFTCQLITQSVNRLYVKNFISVLSFYVWSHRTRGINMTLPKTTSNSNSLSIRKILSISISSSCTENLRHLLDWIFEYLLELIPPNRGPLTKGLDLSVHLEIIVFAWSDWDND